MLVRPKRGGRTLMGAFVLDALSENSNLTYEYNHFEIPIGLGLRLRGQGTSKEQQIGLL